MAQISNNTTVGTTLGTALVVVGAIITGVWRVAAYAGDITQAKEAADKATAAAAKVAEQNQELVTQQAVAQSQIGQLIEVVKEQSRQIGDTHDSVVRLEAQSARRGQQ